MLCSVRYLFVISTSAVDCLGIFMSQMTHYVSSGRLTLLTDQILAAVMNYRMMKCSADVVVVAVAVVLVVFVVAGELQD